MSFTTVTVTGTYLLAPGRPAAGKITFQLTHDMTDGSSTIGANTPISVTLDGTGSFTVQLFANDDTTTLPVGTAWQVTEILNLPYQPSNSYFVQLSKSATAVNIAALVPVVPISQFGGYAPLPGGVAAVGEVPFVTSTSPLALTWGSPVSGGVTAALMATLLGSQSYTYYVDPVNGSDSAAGTILAPFASLAHALSVATSGQSIGVKCGTVQRTTSSLTTTVASITIGSYGTGALPIISGGTLLTSWSSAGGTAGTFQAALTTSPSMVVSGATTSTAPGATALTQGPSATTLGPNQWFWASNVLYVNLGGKAPTSVEAATTSRVMTFGTSGQTVTLTGLDLRFGIDASLFVANVASIFVTGCNFQWTGYAANSGNVAVQDITTGGKISNNTFVQLMNDGIWMHDAPNVEISYNTMSQIGWLAGDVQSDGIQVEDTYNTNPNSSGLWIHHNTITMGASSPKGCVILNADPSTGATPSAIVEYNTLIGGNYGVAIHASNSVVRFNTMLHQVTTFGGGIHLDTAYVLDSISIYRNLIVSPNLHGIIFQDGSNNLTNLIMVNNTIFNAGRASLYLGRPISGVIENNILWWTVQPSLRSIYILSVVSSHTLTCDYNDVGPAFSGYLRDGSNTYSTLSAWTTATSRDSHSIAGDPLFSNDGNYTLLQSPNLSPAINAGTAVSPITNGFLGAAPDMGYVEVA